MECPPSRKKLRLAGSVRTTAGAAGGACAASESESARLQRPTPPQRRCIHNCETQLRVACCTRPMRAARLHPQQLPLAITSAHEVARHPVLHVRIIGDDRPRVTGDTGGPQIIHRPRRRTRRNANRCRCAWAVRSRVRCHARCALSARCALVCQVYKFRHPRSWVH